MTSPMKLDETGLPCQIPCLPVIAEGIGEVPPQSLARRLKLFIRRRLSPSRERKIKRATNSLLNRFSWLSGKGGKPQVNPGREDVLQLQTGDWVRVRSTEEIHATLDHWRQLKGCTFMPEMAQFCGTVQRVLKPMGRFVDERDLRVKRTSGIILLEGVLCQGTADFGRCDRSCFYFWRVEWLEKTAPPPSG